MNQKMFVLIAWSLFLSSTFSQASGADSIIDKSGIILQSPISLNVVVFSISDQTKALENVLEIKEVVSQIDQIQSTLPEHSALMVLGFISPAHAGPVFRDTYIRLGAYQVGRGTRPIGELFVRNYKDSNAKDIVEFTPNAP